MQLLAINDHSHNLVSTKVAPKFGLINLGIVTSRVQRLLNITKGIVLAIANWGSQHHTYTDRKYRCLLHYH